MGHRPTGGIRIGMLEVEVRRAEMETAVQHEHFVVCGQFQSVKNGWSGWTKLWVSGRKGGMVGAMRISNWGMNGLTKSSATSRRQNYSDRKAKR